MVSFSVSLVLLVAGYLVYGKVAERVFGMDPARVTPACEKADGVDFIVLPGWRIFMIQFLNIAGLGPIFGAILGARFGAMAYIWIVAGCIFAGAVHDYFSGMISLRNGGMSFPEIVGKYMGRGFMQAARVFTPLMMILVGVVFVAGPAGLLTGLTAGLFSGFPDMAAGKTPGQWCFLFWSAVIFAYYLLATILPVDRVIGRIYPLFAAALLFMALGILVALYVHFPAIPEVTDGLANTHPDAATTPVFPMLFITIACGALSGFHATQSPMMARCMENERQGRAVFYGAMIAEGVVALIWAAAASYVFHSPEGRAFFHETNAAVVVDFITREWLGTAGAVVAVLGVVVAPVTSGDTAFRSARLIVADALRVDQRPVMKRLGVSLPLFAGGFLLMALLDFSVVWRYFAWMNQILGALALWTATVYLARKGRRYVIALLPACFMTAVVSSYVVAAPEMLGMPGMLANGAGIGAALACLAGFFAWKVRFAGGDQQAVALADAGPAVSFEKSGQ
ncbi:MAG: carbon starvation protein A [Alistipes senegalensis]|nr:carbon starvation protein A [Oxalobacter formigenes]MCM1281530.1 carbon starvation protein A [Alistipes senegalensis]